MTRPVLRNLTKRSEFLFVRHGARAVRSHVLIEARRRAEDGAVGVGFTATRKLGGAVVRNRARRRLREAARQLLPVYGVPGADYVFVARQQTPEAPWEALLDDVRNALLRLRADLEKGAAPGPRGPAARSLTQNDISGAPRAKGD
jgi:ribonuclease P protein component